MCSSLPVTPPTKIEEMRECLRSLKQSNKDDDAKVKTAFNTLFTYVKNAATKPEEEKFRKIRLSNAAFQDRVGKLEGGIKFLELCGFEKIEGDDFLFLARDKIDKAVLMSAGVELNRFFTRYESAELRYSAAKRRASQIDPWEN
ncbi:PUB domain-containing protein [Artemisia annua]|uniref:PUB domain-containing protein n=1 Tax=Artemisia annua TaxID=35608 RepID=A0A2U1LIU0_ARTAN|nr:PUB domain-containing protein [Artemisia annua]